MESEYVSSSTVVEENLPYPFVHYSMANGVFLGFAKQQDSDPYLCSCSKPALQNFILLNELDKTENVEGRLDNIQDYIFDDEADLLIWVAPLRSVFFPDYFARKSLKHRGNPLDFIKFEDNLCHRCNLSKPTMEGGGGSEFMKYYVWYVNQAFYRFGVQSHTFTYLDICPDELKEFVDTTHKTHDEYYLNQDKIRDSEILKDLRRKSDKAHRLLEKEIENIVRKEFGYKKVGEGWISESMLFKIVQKLYSEQEIERHYRPDWLDGLELDIYLPNKKLALEYQGQQHYHPIEIWGGETALKALQDRDRKKALLCEKKGIRLIAIKYTEPLTEEHILSRIE